MKLNGDLARLSAIRADSLGHQFRDTYFLKLDNSNNKVRQTEEYKKLREKFDKEVKELQEKIEKKEKVERGNKGTRVIPAVMLYNNKNFTSPVKALNTENAVVTYKNKDFKVADQLALKTFIKTDNVNLLDNNNISIVVK